MEQGQGFSITNLGGLEKPATALVEKISEAMGGVFRPFQIRRVAAAEADAAVIKAEAELKVERLRAEVAIDISDIQRRAVARLFIEEGQKQENIENITRKALPELSENAEPQNIENDWIVNFFDKCRLISDEEMQSLWAKILAGEANSPGKFSRRTLDTLNSLNKKEAIAFTKLCSFVWTIEAPQEFLVPFIYDFDSPVYCNHQVNVYSLNHLDEINLIKFNQHVPFRLDGQPQSLIATYFEKKHRIQLFDVWSGGYYLNAGNVRFTQQGHQLAGICKAEPIDEFYEFTIHEWQKMNVTVD